MSYQTHDLAEWAAFLSLGVGFTATGWLLWLLLFEPFLGCDLDPRPLVARAVHRLLADAARARLGALQARDRARMAVVTALLALALRLNSIPSAPQKGALR